jgi:predicted transcriptional regulator
MRTLVIGMASSQYIRQRTIDIAAGRIVPKASDPKVWVSSMESIGRLLSTDNYAMIEAIRTHHPATISELAKLVSREQANVSRTLSRMADFHIVDFEESNGKKRPVVNWDEISIIPTVAA